MPPNESMPDTGRNCQEHNFVSRKEKRSDCPNYLYAYWNYHDELTLADGLILKGTLIVTPKSIQPDVLQQQLHYAHQGAENCKLRTKRSMFWATITSAIEELVKKFSLCQHHQKLIVKEPLLPHDMPQKFWHMLGSDVSFWNSAS